MSKNFTRRGFLKGSMAAPAAVALGLSLEEQILLAQETSGKEVRGAPSADEASKGMPMGKIGDVKISRLICGGNLVAGYAHARDGKRSLIYASQLMLHYFTDEKILQTLELAEAAGVNTMVLNNLPRDFRPIQLLNRYCSQQGGKMQWIAQCNPEEDDVKSNVKVAIDHGAIGAFPQGGFGDRWSQDQRVELLGQLVDFVKQNGLIAGIAGHKTGTLTAVQRSGIEPDFYFKTLNNVGYASETPQETITVMEGTQKPWIAYKVLGAGRTHPNQGFRYAFQNGADFLCVGMFDFQIQEDMAIVSKTLSAAQNRRRPWVA
jgi:hypothetical protein